jgi:predicted flap endonuclease-1-like 5' DNA nuclease
MRSAENENAPNLAGWFIALAMGLVAFGVAKVVGGLSSPGAVAIGVVVALLAGLLLGMPWGAGTPSRKSVALPLASPVAAPAVAAPQPAAPMAAPLMSNPGAAKRPEALQAARGGRADDLKLILGVGPKLELLCHSLGFYHFDQIANWSADEIAWVDDNLEGFKGRVTRDKWVVQAKILAGGGTVEEAEAAARA